MNIDVTFPGGKRVDARLGSHLIRTDQPTELGGTDDAPAPFDLFLASIATCAGIYVLGFCQARGIPTEGMRLTQISEDDEHGLPRDITLEIGLPANFPDKYKTALVRAVEHCKVKKAIAAPPAFNVVAR